MSRRAFAAWLALCFHGPLVVAGLYRYSYDAATHEFFADHYARSWWGLWEPRWSGGFDVSSYPPLVHQILALLGMAMGPDAAFGALLLATLVAFPLAVHAFARLFVPEREAGAAAIVGVFLPALSLTAHTFGQLPTLVALTLALLVAVEWTRFVEGGRALHLASAAVLTGVTFTAHHATPILFLPPVLAACFALGARRVDLAARIGRALLATGASFAVGVLAVVPLWLWALGAPHQVPIPHASRADLLVDLTAQDQFFWAMYGVVPALAGIGVWAYRTRAAVIAACLATGFAVVGLGGTTPIPALIFGAGWQWLTYDRFALWAAVALLPCAGIAVDRLLASPGRLARASAALALSLLAAYAAIDSALPLLGATAHRHDVRAVADFLNAGDRSMWRYQTFGFAESSSELGRLTPAATIDGSYFTARRIPELTRSGIGMLDYALWWEPSGATLRTVLAAADRYSIRWAFVADPAYDAFLARAGFRYDSSLAGGIEVWDKPDVPPLDPSQLRFGPPDARGIAWGAVPLLLCLVASGLGLARVRRRRVASLAYGVAVAALALVPVAVAVGRWIPLYVARGDGIWLQYRSLSLYPVDLVVLVVVASWATARGFGWSGGLTIGRGAVALGFVALALAAAASAVTAVDPVLALGLALELALLAVFVVAAMDVASTRPRGLLVPLALVVAGEAALALWQAATGSTAPAGALFNGWPREFTAPDVAASVAALPGVDRWLRSYGSFPHPNSLGAFLAIALALVLASPSSLSSRWRHVALAAGGAALTLTLSRSAWMALAIAVVVWLVATGRLRPLIARRAPATTFLVALLLVGGASTAAARFGRLDASIERGSLDERAAENAAALTLAATRPPVGAGSVVVAEQSVARLGEPPHDVLLIAAAEMGVPGVAAWAALFGALLWSAWRRRRDGAARVGPLVAAAVLVPLLLLDHFLWTQPNGRALLALLLALA
ncbi:MAG: O-antigen ligase family protein [Chloroflexota bacterium]|nr:O-antigen ligase family protein [Chloroflexota bacterium]